MTTGNTSTDLTITLADGSTRSAPWGTSVRGLLGDDGEILAASVDNLTVAVDYLLVRSSSLRPVYYHLKEGGEIYRRTLSFILSAAARKLFPASQVIIGHSLQGGYYYDMEGPDVLNGINMARLADEMRTIIAANVPLVQRFMSVNEALELFERLGRDDKVTLLHRNYDQDIPIYELHGFYDIPLGPLAPSTGRVRNFELSLYPPGFVLRFPDKRNVNRMSSAADQTRLFAVYHESKKWSQILGIRNVGDLNEILSASKFHECVQIAEALHEKKIASIADEIGRNFKKSRLIFIAGPSSSGKTTFAKRLSVQLRVNGLRPIAIGLDDYFVDRDKTPKDSKGDFDFEALGALNIDLFNDHLLKLLKGEEVVVPRYDFKSGRSVEGEHHIRLEEDQVLVVEGIHGLNPALTPRVPVEKKFRIYVSALTQLTIDNYNRIPTTDTRLVRRIVRDFAFRGYSALQTINRWPSVIRGEARNIFPYQEEADVIFNTALLYELSVLKSYARRALEQVPPDQPEFAEARRILEFLHLFVEGDVAIVPPTSLLREFIGGSSFVY